MKRLAVILTCFAFGCGHKAPPFSAQAQGLLKKIEQIMPDRKTAVFDQLCKEIDKQHDQNKLTDEEYNALHKVCVQACAGQWDRAEAALKPVLAAQGQKK